MVNHPNRSRCLTPAQIAVLHWLRIDGHSSMLADCPTKITTDAWRTLSRRGLIEIEYHRIPRAGAVWLSEDGIRWRAQPENQKPLSGPPSGPGGDPEM